MTRRIGTCLSLGFGPCFLAVLACACAEDAAGQGGHDTDLPEPQALAVPEAPPGKQLALGRAHGCSLDPAISGLLCWGDNSHGQTDVPPLIDPRFVATGGDVTCAIDGSKVICWGDGAQGPLTAPHSVRNSVQLAVGEGHACALSATGKVRCWGDDTYGQLKVPGLDGVSAIAAGARHSCALTSDGVTCWGDGALGQLDVPALTAPEQLAVGGSHNCVIDQGAVVCWGGDIPALLDDIPTVSSPTSIAAGSSHSCVLGEEGVRCWGDPAATDLTPRELTNVQQLAVGGGGGLGFACARHQQGVACWGDDSLGQTEYNGYPWHVLFRGESEIQAPASAVWDVLMDLDHYPQWNPYTIGMKSTLQIGDPMVMTVKMDDLITLEQTEYIRVLEKDHKVCWGINTDTPDLNSGERCQWLEPLADGGTRYVTEDLIEGTLNPLVLLLFGDDTKVGFEGVAAALKVRVESLYKP
ncbi:MAG TPA: hypothetical protein VG963_21735 [Polyangiaceae bacterium]|nr:hypothetical protein [Polyangiaceae bacterium]